MTLKPLGDSAWLVEFPGQSGELALSRVTGLAMALRETRPDAVLDIVPSFASLAVHFGNADALEVRRWICSTQFEDQLPNGEEKKIPVCYGGEYGPDLAEVAKSTGLPEQEIIALHSGATYTVAAVGFSPGFPYLAGLPDALNLPRKATPRPAVPAGSVAIASGQAGIYPCASPAGWHLLGRTDAVLFDPQSPSPALLQPGDRVRFVPVESLSDPTPAAPLPPAVNGFGGIEVLEPGALTTVQDSGRPGYESYGISPGGAADPYALRLANVLVGNPPDAAGLEICLRGPVLRFHEDTTVALVSDTGRPMRFRKGETADFSKLTEGVRAYLAVAGGLKVPIVSGSAATDLRSRFGGFSGRPLLAGDYLETYPLQSNSSTSTWHIGRRQSRAAIELRFIAGVQRSWFSEAALRRFHQGVYQITPRSDRMGTRLSGEPLDLIRPREMVSQPVACGSIQVPPDGQPIVLLAERQTIGGYPQIGHVITADLGKLARAWPGTAVKFREISVEESWDLKHRAERDFDWLRTGLKLLK